MARQRMLHPDFFTDPKVVSCSPLARLLFQGLWCLADKEGRLEGDLMALKLRVLPADNCDVGKLLGELITVGLVRAYAVEGRALLYLPGFLKRQRPHPKEPGSRLPAPSPNAQPVEIRTAVEKHGEPRKELIDPLSKTVDPSESESESESIKASVEQARPRGAAQAVFEHWKAVMGKPRAIFDDKRKAAVERRLGEGRSVADLKQAIDGCAKTPHNMGQNDRGQRFDDLELICRNGPNVERFMANAQAPPVGRAKPGAPIDPLTQGHRTEGPITAEEVQL